MTYNVFGGTLNPTLLLCCSADTHGVVRQMCGVKLSDKVACEEHNNLADTYRNSNVTDKLRLMMIRPLGL